MRIPGLKTVAVIDDDFVAVAFVAVLGFDYPPLGLNLNLVAGAAGQIDAFVAGFLFIKRIIADAETRSHPIAPHRFADRNVFGNFTIIFQVIRGFKNAGDFIVNVLILQFETGINGPPTESFFLLLARGLK